MALILPWYYYLQTNEIITHITVHFLVTFQNMQISEPSLYNP